MTWTTLGLALVVASVLAGRFTGRAWGVSIVWACWCAFCYCMGSLAAGAR
jgi:hypothetical protein